MHMFLKAAKYVFVDSADSSKRALKFVRFPMFVVRMFVFSTLLDSRVGPFLL